MGKMCHLEDNCENIDASVFSSDILFDDAQREILKNYMGRWERAIKQHESALSTQQIIQEQEVTTRVYHICAECYTTSTTNYRVHHAVVTTHVDVFAPDFYDTILAFIANHTQHPADKIVIHSMSLLGMK